MAFSTDTCNQIFQLAVRFVNQTNRHIFLTGKAGTGKTTFLKYIREYSFKKMAIVAPTGVAAINAGGVTMHSFFQLPLGAFIPTLHGGWNGNNNFNTPHTLFKNLRLNSDKRQLLQELELLVIDEVSMLRADILDEIDCILRHFRKRPLEPFGGVQMLYIGDLFQLPPVVKNDEWDILRQHYRSPFFFDAQALRQKPPLYLELKKIYRQHEQEFISILNNIRNNKTTAEDFDLLHKHYLPDYESPENESYITLTTHNARADTINQHQLDKLAGDVCEFRAEITGDFNERAYPADQLLQLKTGVQIMFIKNDKGESRRYYNGKIAIISRLDKDKIYIRFQDERNEMELEKEIWKNIRYRYNQEKDIIEEEEIGTFKQYPIRLAWAITIHKSQGLTFEKAIIDALSKQQEMAKRFTKQLSQLLENVPQDGYQYLHQRISAGSEYFLKAMNEITISIENHINEVKVRKKTRKYVKSLQTLHLLFERKKQQLKQSIQVVEGLAKGVNAADLLELVERQKTLEVKPIEITGVLAGKPQRGDSHRMSLQMFKEGKDIPEIAQLRGLTVSTIAGHLASFIITGEIKVQEIVSEDKMAVILQTIEELNLQTPAIAAVKEKLGDDFSYTEIKAVFNYVEWLQLNKIGN
jgi:uncharacterized protein YpbB